MVGVFLRFSDAIRLEFTSHDGDIGGGGDAESDPVTSYLEDLDEDASVNHDGVVFFFRVRTSMVSSPWVIRGYLKSL